MKSWILMTTLPDEIRTLPNLLEGDDERDSTYQGFVTMIISLIYLNAGVLQEGAYRFDWLLTLRSRISKPIFKIPFNRGDHSIDADRKITQYNGETRIY